MKFEHSVLMYEFILDMNPISSFTNINWSMLIFWSKEFPKNCTRNLCWAIAMAEGPGED